MLVVLFLLVIGLAVLFLVGVEFCSYAYITKLYGYNVNNQLIFLNILSNNACHFVCKNTHYQCIHSSSFEVVVMLGSLLSSQINQSWQHKPIFICGIGVSPINYYLKNKFKMKTLRTKMICLKVLIIHRCTLYLICMLYENR